MKDLIDDSPFYTNQKNKKEIITDINNNNNSEKYNNNTEFNIDSEYFNINIDERNVDENLITSSVPSGVDESFNFYNVERTNIINYMTPIKNNNKNKRTKKKSIDKIKTNTEISNDVFSLSNSNTGEDKKIMISELDIELSNNSKNNFLTDYKYEKNNGGESMIKWGGGDFRGEIEKNLKKFIKSNEEKNKINNLNKMNNINLQMRLKKHSQNIGYCFTDITHKINKINKINKTNKYKYKNNTNNIAKKNNIINNQNKFGSFISIKNKINLENPLKNKNNTLINNSFKTRTINVTKNNNNKKLNGFIKINLEKKTKINTNKKNEFKSKIFYLQNKKINNTIKKKELTDYNNSHSNTMNSKKKIRNDYFSISEKKRVINKQEKKNESNIKEKNIIIQNFNCIDYNSINININNDNIIKKLSHRRNVDKNNIFNNNKKNYTSINNNIFAKKDKVNIFYNSYIKNFFTEKKNFQRKHNEKKLTFVENNNDIKNKIFNYYLNKKEQNSKNNDKNKIKVTNNLKNKLVIKPNNLEFKKYFNTIASKSLRLSKQKTFKNNKKSSFLKLLMSKKQ